jgi:hypothetical protein
MLQYTAAELINLAHAYELVGNDLERRGVPKLAAATDKEFRKLSQAGFSTVTPGFNITDPALKPIWESAMTAHYQGNGQGWDIINKAIADPASTLTPQQKQQLKTTFSQWAAQHQPYAANQPNDYATNATQPPTGVQ